MFLDSNTKRETGRKAQLGNIEAAKVNGYNVGLVLLASPSTFLREGLACETRVC